MQSVWCLFACTNTPSLPLVGRFLGDDDLPQDDKDIMKGVQFKMFSFFALLILVIFSGAFLVTFVEVYACRLVFIRISRFQYHCKLLRRNLRLSMPFFGRFKRAPPSVRHFTAHTISESKIRMSDEPIVPNGAGYGTVAMHTDNSKMFASAYSAFSVIVLGSSVGILGAVKTSAK